MSLRAAALLSALVACGADSDHDGLLEPGLTVSAAGSDGHAETVLAALAQRIQ